MNERFNDLRLDAGISRLHEVPYMVAVNKEGEIIEPLDGLQKFAELIGRECLTLADSVRDNLDEDGEKQQALGAAWVGLAITRHFGFEE